jgi:hypothetical protein
VKSVDELYGSRERRVRRDSVAAGLVIGALSAALVVIAVGFGLARWQERNHQRLLAEATAAINQRLGLCQANLKRYEAVVALAEAIESGRVR